MSSTTEKIEKMGNEVTDIKVAVSRIEQHLSNINGEVQDTKEFKHGCPNRMKQIQQDIQNVKMDTQRNTIIIGVGIALLNVLVMYAINR